jgi:Sigma-70, region 4
VLQGGLCSAYYGTMKSNVKVSHDKEKELGELMVIEMRFGLKGGRAESLVAIGEALNMSRERVR